MKIYRVFTAYHEPDESGTYEYGCYSSFEKAEKRVSEVWKEKNYPEPKPEDKTPSGWYSNSLWDSISVRISEIEIDNDIDEEFNGYT